MGENSGRLAAEKSGTHKKPAAAYACIPSPEQPDENDTDSFQRVSVKAGIHDALGNRQAGLLAFGRLGLNQL